MKTILKNRIFSLGIVLMTIMILVISCQDNYDENVSTNLMYLSFNNNPSNIDDIDWSIVQLAIQRMNIEKYNGEYTTCHVSGNQVNISEELYDFILNMINETNCLNANYKINASVPRLKNDNEGDNNATTSYDCVAQAISMVLSMLGANIPASDINAWMVNKYGNNGVPGNAFNEAVSHFLQGSSSSLPNNYNITSNSNEKYIVVERTSATTGHAGVLVAASGNSIIYKDNTGTPRFCNTSDIVYTYKVTGAQ